MPLVIPYTDQTWVDGSGGGTPISAARLNVVEAGVKAAHFMPAVRVYNNAAININTATATALTFNSERFDTAANAAGTMHDTSVNTSRLTCRYAGKYQISGTMEYASNATGNRQAQILLNNTTTIAAELIAAVNGATTRITISTLYDLAVNDYVELIAVQTSGGGLNVTAAGNYSPEFMMVRVA